MKTHMAAPYLLPPYKLPNTSGGLRAHKPTSVTASKQAYLFTKSWAICCILAFPAVSSLAFRGLQCEEFEDSRGVQRRLKADYEVDCDNEEDYGPVKRLSWLAIVLYPIGVPAIYCLLLRAAKSAIVKDRPTALSRALGWLHRDFEPECYYWEILEVFRGGVPIGSLTITTDFAPPFVTLW